MQTLRRVVFVAILVGFGCSPDIAKYSLVPPQVICALTASVSCTCADGLTGTASCNSSGTAYDQCVCIKPVTPAVVLSNGHTAVTAGQSYTAQVTSPVAGLTYTWSVNNGDVTGATTGPSFGFQATAVGTLELAAAPTNAGGDTTAPGLLVVDVVAPPPSVTTINLPSALTTGKMNLPVSVFSPQPNTMYVWSASGNVRLATGPSSTTGMVTVNVGAVGPQSATLTCTAYNAAGDAGATPGNATVDVVDQGLYLVAGQLGGAGFVDAVGTDARFCSQQVDCVAGPTGAIGGSGPVGGSGSIPGTFGPFCSIQNTCPTSFLGPAMALDGNGNLFLSDDGNLSVRQVVTSGANAGDVNTYYTSALSLPPPYTLAPPLGNTIGAMAGVAYDNNSLYLLYANTQGGGFNSNSQVYVDVINTTTGNVTETTVSNQGVNNPVADPAPNFPPFTNGNPAYGGQVTPTEAANGETMANPTNDLSLGIAVDSVDPNFVYVIGADNVTPNSEGNNPQAAIYVIDLSQPTVAENNGPTEIVLTGAVADALSNTASFLAIAYHNYLGKKMLFVSSDDSASGVDSILRIDVSSVNEAALTGLPGLPSGPTGGVATLLDSNDYDAQYTSLAVDPSGNLFLGATKDCKTYSYSCDPTVNAVYVVPAGVAAASGPNGVMPKWLAGGPQAVGATGPPPGNLLYQAPAPISSTGPSFGNAFQFASVGALVAGPSNVFVFDNESIDVISNYSAANPDPNTVMVQPLVGSPDGRGDVPSDTSSVPLLSGRFDTAAGVAVDSNGVIYLADGSDETIADSTDPNNAFFASDGLTQVIGIYATLDVSSPQNNKIRTIAPNGLVTTLAGQGNGQGNPGVIDNPLVDGPGRAAHLGVPQSLVVTPNGTVIFSDIANQILRQISPQGLVSAYTGIVNLDATIPTNGPLDYVDQGTGAVDAGEAYAYSDGFPGNATFFIPFSLALAPGGTIYVADEGDQAVRSVLPNGEVITVANSNADPTTGASALGDPWGVAVDPFNNLVVADLSTCTVREINTSTYQVLPLVGENCTNPCVGSYPPPLGTQIQDGACTCATTDPNTPSSGCADSSVTPACFASPYALATDPLTGDIYVADYTFIRRISTSTGSCQVTTVMGVEDVLETTQASGPAALGASSTSQATIHDIGGMAFDPLTNDLVLTSEHSVLRMRFSSFSSGSGASSDMLAKPHTLARPVIHRAAQAAKRKMLNVPLKAMPVKAARAPLK